MTPLVRPVPHHELPLREETGRPRRVGLGNYIVRETQKIAGVEWADFILYIPLAKPGQQIERRGGTVGTRPSVPP